ncbi:hypothetical protein [Vibrio ulleungensis]|uniref:DUF3955 domain-containing protein n=1 Tax=Vibrio ulleungensis TaxID=2807619 RepID=A0ABS2HHD9_9VIBR|nr:hypothetical protein [Vibrio ulleungensis]MBM7035507.1 hypothetical protein [Vibrio ulleungensis]
MKSNLELKLVAVAIVIALLNIIAHLLMSEFFHDFPLLEYSLASIPIMMLLLCLGALRAATRAWRNENEQNNRSMSASDDGS